MPIGASLTRPSRWQWKRTKRSAEVWTDKHPNTLTMGYYLAEIYREQGKWDKAESVAVKIYETGRSALGDTSRDVMIWRFSLGRIYAERKDYARAEPLLVRSVADFRLRKPKDDN